MRIASLLLLLCLPFVTQALSLKVEARATTESQAKREALAALADSILVEVKSEVTSNVKGTGERQDEHRISSSSDIPLIGVDLKCIPSGGEVQCEARLDSSKSLLIYTRKLEDLRREVGELDARISKIEANSRYPQLVQLLTLAEQYDKYRAVAQLLGETQFTPPAKTRSDIQEQLRVLEKLTPTLDLAAQVIAKGLRADALYIYPAAPHGSHEVTAFGRVIRDKLAQQLNPLTSPENASHFLKGEYEQLDNSIHLTYRLLDSSGNTIETRIAAIAADAYKGVQTKPTTVDFDRLLHEGVVLGNDFKAQLNSNRGSENVLFDEKDEVELFVKVSRPGYFYVVGHVVKKDENFSYLLELSQADRDRRFIRYANADDVNKWLSVGRFEATPPFGIESLQLIASSDDPINRLPSHPLDKKTELYVTANNAQQGITKTRALKPKRSDADKQYQAEAVLMFTTMPKAMR
jgi:hypothetical protein